MNQSALHDSGVRIAQVLPVRISKASRYFLHRPFTYPSLWLLTAVAFFFVVAETDDGRTLVYPKPAPAGAKKVFYFFGEENDNSPTLAAIRAGFSHLGLSHGIVAHSATEPTQIEDEMREDKVAGGIVPLSSSKQLVSEAEYVTDEQDQIGSINVVTKDDFKDLHIANTYITVLRSLILEHMPKSGEAKVLVLGNNAPISKAVRFILEELGIPLTTWDFEGADSFELSSFDFTGISHVISGLSGDLPFPSFPDSALGPDTLVIDVQLGEKSTPLVQAAKAAKSTLVTGAELDFEATLAAFQILVTPTAVPPTIQAPANVMAKAFIDASPAAFQQEAPPMIAKHL